MRFASGDFEMPATAGAARLASTIVLPSAHFAGGSRSRFLGESRPFSDKFDLGEPSMPSLTNLFAFAFVALGMVLTPGPNMIYLISRSIIQSRVAGLISLGGVALGFVRGVWPHRAHFRCAIRL